jgi:branched-subunit amino acid transport protein
VSPLAAILAIGLGSFALRYALVGLGDRALPPALERTSGLVAPAAFSAMAVVGLLHLRDLHHPSHVGDRTLVAGGLVTLAVGRRRSAPCALAAGLFAAAAVETALG